MTFGFGEHLRFGKMPSKEDSPVLSRADSKCNEHGTPVFRVTSPDGLEVDGGEQGRYSVL